MTTKRKRKKPIIKRANKRGGLPKPKVRPRRKGSHPTRPKLADAPKRVRAKKPAPRDVGPLDLIGEAFSEITELAEEMRTWADNMEGSLSHTDKFSQVSDAAEALENIEKPTVDIQALNDHMLSWQDPAPRRRPYSRAERAGHACDKLTAVNERMRELTNELPEDDPQYDAAVALSDELEVAINEIEEVGFPGMFS